MRWVYLARVAGKCNMVMNLWFHKKLGISKMSEQRFILVYFTLFFYRLDYVALICRD
jgi:hypothetical protein